MNPRGPYSHGAVAAQGGSKRLNRALLRGLARQLQEPERANGVTGVDGRRSALAQRIPQELVEPRPGPGLGWYRHALLAGHQATVLPGLGHAPWRDPVRPGTGTE